MKYDPFLYGIEFTDTHPWIGLVGLLVMLIAGCCLDGWLP